MQELPERKDIDDDLYPFQPRRAGRGESAGRGRNLARARWSMSAMKKSVLLLLGVLCVGGAWAVPALDDDESASAAPPYTAARVSETRREEQHAIFPTRLPGIPEYLRTPGPVPLERPLPEPLSLLGEEIQPGELKRLAWYDRQSFPGLESPAPVLVAHGRGRGPVLCLTAAIHGDELNGIEIVRNLIFGIDPARLNGTVIGVPIVNLHGFRRQSRYLPDRRDLNRFFPGNDFGSSASRIAHSFFQSVVMHCDALVDLHTGSLRRTNLPQVRADLNNDDIEHLTRGFGATVVLHSAGTVGTLRRAAADTGIPAVTLEAGEPMRFQPDEVSHGVKALRSLLSHLEMDSNAGLWREPQSVYYRSSWVRADAGGILTNRVELGQQVEQGALLGTLTDPITNERAEIRSPYQGRILGMALNQAMMPGFAAYHIGIETPPFVGPLPWDAMELMEVGDDAGLQREGDRNGMDDAGLDTEDGRMLDEVDDFFEEDFPPED